MQNNQFNILIDRLDILISLLETLLETNANFYNIFNSKFNSDDKIFNSDDKIPFLFDSNLICTCCEKNKTSAIITCPLHG